MAVTFKSLLIAVIHLHKTWMLLFYNFSAEMSKIIVTCMHIYRVKPATPNKFSTWTTSLLIWLFLFPEGNAYCN